MRKWEYRKESVRPYDRTWGGPGIEGMNLVDGLNYLGSEGCELVHVNQPDIVFIFKRCVD